MFTHLLSLSFLCDDDDDDKFFYSCFFGLCNYTTTFFYDTHLIVHSKKMTEKRLSPTDDITSNISLTTKRRKMIQPTSLLPIMSEEKRIAAKEILSLSHLLWTIVFPNCYSIFFHTQYSRFESICAIQTEYYRDMTAAAEALFPLVKLVIKRGCTVMSQAGVFIKFLIDRRKKLADEQIKTRGCFLRLDADFEINISSVMTLHLSHGDIEMADYLVERKLFVIRHNTREHMYYSQNFPTVKYFETAVKNGKVQVLSWLLKHFTAKCCVKDAWDTFEEACFTNDTRVVTFIADNFGIDDQFKKRYTTSLLCKCCSLGFLSIVQLLCERFKAAEEQPLADNQRTFIGACENGHIEVAKWFMENTCEGKSGIGSYKSSALQIVSSMYTSPLHQCTLRSTEIVRVTKWLFVTFKIEQTDVISLDITDKILRRLLSYDEFDAVKWVYDYFSLQNPKERYFRRAVCNLVIIYIARDYAAMHEPPAYVEDLPIEINMTEKITWIIKTFDLTEMDIREDVLDEIEFEGMRMCGIKDILRMILQSEDCTKKMTT
jgi:hypothetical protein